MLLFSLALGLAMDAFAVSVTNGIKQTTSKFRHALISALFFGIFQGVMPFLGWGLGSAFASKIESFDHWIIFLILAFVGGHMIFEALNEKEEEYKEEKFDFKSLIMMAIATSIDALAIGVSFALSGVSTLQEILFNCAVIAVITTIVCICGFYIGRFFRNVNKKIAEIAGGAVLIILGLVILIEHLTA